MLYFSSQTSNLMSKNYILILLLAFLCLPTLVFSQQGVSAEDYDAHGNQLLRERQFDRAARAYEKATELKPDDSH